jgi:hypothetical protein
MSSSSFETALVKTFFDMTTHLKIFHWQTQYFSNHKSADELVSELLESMDEFMEIYQGIVGHRISLQPSTSMTISNMNMKKIVKKMQDFISFLGQIQDTLPEDLMKQQTRKQKKDWKGLMNIRDEIIGKVQTTLYLFTFV